MKAWLLILLLCVVTAATSTEVKLLTIGPGDQFWSAYGHTALSFDGEVYGFGYFSFEDEGLISAFIDNQMYYDIGVSDLQGEYEMAQWQNRTFIVQDLYLDDAKIRQIKDYLNWHNLPENQSYHYDYFINNCATKIRDIINDGFYGLLKDQFNQVKEASYYSQTFPAKNQALMNFGIVLGYGWSAYEKRTAWELMAFPLFLQAKLSDLPSNKISTAEVLNHSKSNSKMVSWVKTHWFLWFYTMVLFLGLSFNKTQSIASGIVVTFQLLLGLAILYFWLFSGHEITRWNMNILLFSPLACLLLISKKIKWFMLLSYAAWTCVALYLHAWYFLPICGLHSYWLYIATKQSD